MPIPKCQIGRGVFRRGVSTMIGVGVPLSQFNEVNGLKGSRHADGGQCSISIRRP
jgi:hypothetical protein